MYHVFAESGGLIIWFSKKKETNLGDLIKKSWFSDKKCRLSDLTVITAWFCTNEISAILKCIIDKFSLDLREKNT